MLAIFYKICMGKILKKPSLTITKIGKHRIPVFRNAQGKFAKLGSNEKQHLIIKYNKKHVRQISIVTQSFKKPQIHPTKKTRQKKEKINYSLPKRNEYNSTFRLFIKPLDRKKPGSKVTLYILVEIKKEDWKYELQEAYNYRTMIVPLKFNDIGLTVKQAMKIPLEEIKAFVKRRYPAFLRIVGMYQQRGKPITATHRKDKTRSQIMKSVKQRKMLQEMVKEKGSKQEKRILKSALKILNKRMKME